MGLFQSLVDILSGRRYHKNTTNNVVLSNLWRRCSVLPAHQELFREYVVSASVVADEFFFSPEHPKEIIAKDYSIAQFQHFYESVIAFRAFASGVVAPELRPGLRRCLSELVMDRERVEILLVELDAHGGVDRAGAGLVYEHLINEAGVGARAISPFVKFTVACLAACGARDI